MNTFAALNETTNQEKSPRKLSQTLAKQAKDGRTDDLSEESSESEDDPEVMQQDCHSLYNKGLGYYASEHYNAAIRAFQDVLMNKFLTKEFFAKLEISRKLKFNTLKYLGFCYGHKNNFETALPLLLDALKLDKDDVNLSIKVAMYAIRLGQQTNLALATAALENALRLSPNHWPCLELIINCTFELQDYQACLCFIDQALRRKPHFARGIQLRQAILKLIPEFEPFCPDGSHIRKDIPFKEVIADFRPKHPIEDDRDEDDYHEMTIGDVTWAELLDALLSEKKVLQRKGVLPLYVKMNYVKSKFDPMVEVSVQNVVQEMIDIISGPTQAQLIVSDIVEGIFEASLLASNKFLVSTILNEVMEEVVTSAVPPKKSPSKASSFLSEVPLDLLEIRRSSRVKETLENQVEDSSNEEMTAQAILEGFIPKSLKKLVTDEIQKKKESKEKEKNHPGTDTIKILEFPNDHKQCDQVRSFLESQRETSIDMLIWLALDELCKMTNYTWPTELKNAFFKTYLVWRNGFRLPNEFSKDTNMSYMEIILIANEILLDYLKEGESSEGDMERFVEADFLHMRLSYDKITFSQKVRIYYLQHQFYLEKKEIEKALYYGKMVVEDLLECVEEFSAPEWNITTTVFNKESIKSAISFLEHSKILHKVQEFYDDKEYQKVVDILSQTIDTKHDKGGQEDETWLLRLFMLIESLWELEKYEACLEKTVLALSRAVVTEDLADLNNILTTLTSCFQVLDSIQLSPSVGSSFCDSLISIMLGQINNTLQLKSITPWILFYKVIQVEEEGRKSTNIVSNDSEIPMSAHFLVSAHEYTGKLSLCTDGNGQLLLLIVRALIPLIKKKSFAQYMHDSIKKNLDQALYCLCCHPSKKSKAKYLVDHGAQTLALTWDKCSLLYQVVKPSKLPEFDDYKSCSINADAEALLRRFVALVPDEFNLKTRIEKIEDYFDGEEANFPDFRESNAKFPREIKDMFYLLGDYNFKNSNFDTSLDFFRQDLSFNPNRLDSYVDMALASANSVETKISQSYCDDVEDILRDAWSVTKIFKECHKKDSSNPTICIESANFSYVMNAYCSRVLKSEANTLSMEKFNQIEKYKNSFLNFAQMSYKKAFDLSTERVRDDPNATDERWLVYLFIGKIMEKRSRDIVVCLRQYLKAMRNLKNQGEFISRKIVFNQTPQDLQMEFLEIYYRFHASILKLELQPGFEPTKEMINGILKLFEELEEISIFESEDSGASTAKKQKVDSISEDTEKSQGDIEGPPPKKSRLSDECQNWTYISETCITNLERVKSIYAHHYKALHLLAFYFMADHSKHDAKRAKEYLLHTNSNTRQSTLFGDRKVNNLFNGIWRSPIGELERAGSFPTHVGKCISVLFDMLRETEDYMVFMEAASALKRSVDGDKQYLFDKDRQNYYIEACTSLIQIVSNKAERYIRQEKKTDIKKLRFMLDLNQFRAKKGLTKANIDQLKVILKKVFCSVVSKSECTYEEMNSFMSKLQAKDKCGELKDISSAEQVSKVVSECLGGKSNNEDAARTPGISSNLPASIKALTVPQRSVLEPTAMKTPVTTISPKSTSKAPISVASKSHLTVSPKVSPTVVPKASSTAAPKTHTPMLPKVSSTMSSKASYVDTFSNLLSSLPTSAEGKIGVFPKKPPFSMSPVPLTSTSPSSSHITNPLLKSLSTNPSEKAKSISSNPLLKNLQKGPSKPLPQAAKQSLLKSSPSLLKTLPSASSSISKNSSLGLQTNKSIPRSSVETKPKATLVPKAKKSMPQSTDASQQLKKFNDELSKMLFSTPNTKPKASLVVSKTSTNKTKDPPKATQSHQRPTLSLGSTSKVGYNRPPTQTSTFSSGLNLNKPGQSSMSKMSPNASQGRKLGLSQTKDSKIGNKPQSNKSKPGNDDIEVIVLD